MACVSNTAGSAPRHQETLAGRADFAVPISNAALPAQPAAFKSPDGEQDRRGDEGSCGSRSEGERCQWDLVRQQGLGPGLWVAG